MSESGVPLSVLAQRDALLSRLCGQTWPYGPLLDALELAPEWDVLDIGAGDGGLLHELARRGHTGSLTGLDLHPGAGVLLGRAEHLPFPEESFDVVFMLRVLAHLPDQAKTLAEARRVLRPAGRIVIAAHGAGHLRAFWTMSGQRQPLPQPSRLDIRLPVELEAADAQALAQSYGLDIGPLDIGSAEFPITDQLHLAVSIQKRP